MAAGDQLVVFNLGSPGGDAYAGGTRRALTSTGTALTALICTVGSSQLPYPSPSSGFQVVGPPVTYWCYGVSAGNSGVGTLRRYTGCAIRSAQPGHSAAAPLHRWPQWRRAPTTPCWSASWPVARSATRPAPARATASAISLKCRPRWAEIRKRGFALVSAVFILVSLALLGAMIVNLSSGNQVGQTRDLLGSRAYFAARTGIDWGVYRALQAGSCAASSTLPALAGSSAGFSVTVASSARCP